PADSLAKVPLAGPVMLFGRTEPIERDHEQKVPQFLARRQLIPAGACGVEEAAEDRLHDVVGIEPASDAAAKLGPREGANAVRISAIEFVGGFRAAVAKSLEQASVGDFSVSDRRTWLGQRAARGGRGGQRSGQHRMSSAKIRVLSRPTR